MRKNWHFWHRMPVMLTAPMDKVVFNMAQFRHKMARTKKEYDEHFYSNFTTGNGWPYHLPKVANE
ncbi:hypothetical protein FFRU_041170 [Fructobacillus fructosus]|nr:hypothetical protein FFRU_041170 [Fructobacillus fructosus]